MIEANNTTASGAAKADASGAETIAIAAASESALEKEHVAAAPATPAKTVVAHGIYTSWRNAHLHGISTVAFTQIEAASPALIAAIAAAL